MAGRGVGLAVSVGGGVSVGVMEGAGVAVRGGVGVASSRCGSATLFSTRRSWPGAGVGAVTVDGVALVGMAAPRVRSDGAVVGAGDMVGAVRAAGGVGVGAAVLAAVAAATVGALGAVAAAVAAAPAAGVGAGAATVALGVGDGGRDARVAAVAEGAEGATVSRWGRCVACGADA